MQLDKQRTIPRAMTVIALALAMLLATACGDRQETAGESGAASQTAAESSVSAPAEPRTVTDEQGHEVEIPARPQRILAPYLEDALSVLGITPVAQWSVGSQIQDYLQDKLAGVPKIDLNGGLKPEAALATSPDLMIFPFGGWAADGKYDGYAKIAPTYVFNQATSDWRKTLLALGDLLNKSDVARQALQDYERKTKEARERIHEAIGDKKVAIVWIKDKSFQLLGGSFYSADVLFGADLGLTPDNLTKTYAWKDGIAAVSLEKLPELDADYIFLIPPNESLDQSGGAGADELFASPLWKNLPAVKQGRVYDADFAYWVNSGYVANQLIIADVEQALAGQ